MKKMVVLVFLFHGCLPVFAQQSDSISRVKFPHFTTFTEVGGSAIYYSQNVEFFISNNRTVNFNIRAGIGVYDKIRTPFLINAIIGRKKSKLEVGIGIMLDTRIPPSVATTIGYRHQSDNGLFYRIAFTPLFNDEPIQKILPMGGLSLGYYFGYRKTKEEIKRRPIANLDSADNKLNLIIKTDLLGAGGFLAYKRGYYGSLTIEKGFKRRHSVQVTGIYAGNEYKDTFSDSSWYHRKTSGFQIIPEYKYFFGKRRYYTGFYSGAYAKYAYIKTEMDSRGYYQCS